MKSYLYGFLFMFSVITIICTQTRPEYCQLAAEPGLCLAYMPRYFWNGTSKQCDQFIYGGCQGNENNFETIEACRDACSPYPESCKLCPATGPCKGSFPRYFWNGTSKQCDKFIYGGCQGNENNFKTIEACRDACSPYPESCKLSPAIGPCEGYFPRYFWNETSKQCNQFIYGGCQGNENNFETVEACRDACSPC